MQTCVEVNEQTESLHEDNTDLAALLTQCADRNNLKPITGHDDTHETNTSHTELLLSSQ